MKLKTKNTVLEHDDVSIISAGVNIEGKITSKGNVRIDGFVKGDLTTTGNLTVGETGEINGNVVASHVTMGGKVLGSVTAKEKLVLESKSIFKGDLITKILVVEAGAKFDGKSVMSSSPAENKSTPAFIANINESK